MNIRKEGEIFVCLRIWDNKVFCGRIIGRTFKLLNQRIDAVEVQLKFWAHLVLYCFFFLLSFYDFLEQETALFYHFE